MAITASASDFTSTSNGGSASPTVTLPTSVPAGACIVLGVLNRTDETTTISSITDTVNGTWNIAAPNSTGGLASGPTDHSASTYRVWLLYRLNSDVGTPTITVNFSASIITQMVAGWIDDSTGPEVFDVAATAANVTGSNTVAASNTLTAAGSGAIVGFFTSNNAQTDPEPSVSEGNEVRLTPTQAGSRACLFFETYTTGGTKGFTGIAMDSGNYIFQCMALLAPTVGSHERTPLVGAGVLTGVAPRMDLGMRPSSAIRET